MVKVTVIDYGLSNILSLVRALEHCGAEVLVTADPQDAARAERLVLPGVGSFSYGMGQLRQAGLEQPIQDFAAGGGPLLGICLGMQFLHRQSDEGGICAGLGIVPGDITSLPRQQPDGTVNKVPNVGWCRLEPQADWAGTILDGVEPGAFAYFVHSFHAPVLQGVSLASADFNGHAFSAVTRAGNTYGAQFHPEKSGPVGLAILDNFLRLGA